MEEKRVNFQHPANADILKYFRGHKAIFYPSEFGETLPECSPNSLDDPYYELNTHPEMVAWLWNKLNEALPEDCAWVVNYIPCLVHPKTGIIFGYVMGNYIGFLRLPKKISVQMQLNHENDEDDEIIYIGEDWADCSFHEKDKELCQIAYDYATEAENSKTA